LKEILQKLPSGGTAGDAFSDDSYFEEPSKWIDRGAMSGRSNPVAPPLHVEMVGEQAVCKLILSEQYVGAPGIVHGGILSACFDQVCGHCAVANGHPGLTVQLDVRYRHPARVHTQILFEANLVGVSGRQVTVEGRCSRDGKTLATCRAVFVKMERGERPELFGKE